MGLRDFFSSSGRSKSRLDGYIKKVENKYAQSPDRYHAMEKLLELATVPSLIGAMRRFTIAASKSIEDEEEKAWLYRRLSGLEPALVIPAAREFLLNHDNIAWVLRLVEEVATDEQQWSILEEVLERHPPVYERDPTKKLQLLSQLQENADPRVPAVIARYVEDPDEGLRFASVEGLARIGAAESMEPLLARLVHPDEDSLRIRNRILAAFATLRWDISAHKAAIAPFLGQDFAFDGNHIRAR